MNSIPNKHKEKAPKKLGFGIIVVSSSKYRLFKNKARVDDVSGRLATALLEENGHEIFFYTIIPDSKLHILHAVTEALLNDKVDVVVTIGGTGLSATDVTIESLKPVFDKEVEGFGDVFRSISFREIGATSYMSRATAGVIAGKVIYCLPGSPHAVKVAIKELILPEAGHLVYIARRDLR